MKTLSQEYESVNRMKKIWIAIGVSCFIGMFAIPIVDVILTIFFSDVVDGFKFMKIYGVEPIFFMGIAASFMVGMFVISPHTSFIRCCNRLKRQKHEELLENSAASTPVFRSRNGYSLYIENGLLYTNNKSLVLQLDEIKNMFGMPNTRDMNPFTRVNQWEAADLRRTGMTKLNRPCYIVFVMQDGFRAVSLPMTPADANPFVDAIMNANPEITWGRNGDAVWEPIQF